MDRSSGCSCCLTNEHTDAYPGSAYRDGDADHANAYPDANEYRYSNINTHADDYTDPQQNAPSNQYTSAYDYPDTECGSHTDRHVNAGGTWRRYRNVDATASGSIFRRSLRIPAAYQPRFQ